VIASRSCQFAAPVLIAMTVCVAALPPAHVHLGGHDHAGIEHSHWTPHHGGFAAFDDDDGRVLFVTHAALPGSSFDVSFVRPAPAVIAILVLPAPAVLTVAERPTSGNSPRDGPAPDLSTFRGPPFVL
jgi:hypothetical protein